jgi:hypothetical protein
VTATVEVLETDITTLAVDAIANAANTRLWHGGGVAGAIVSAGGEAIQQESDRRAPVGLGEAIETTAGTPARWVITRPMELGADLGEIIAARPRPLAGRRLEPDRWPSSRDGVGGFRSRRRPRSR